MTRLPWVLLCFPICLMPPVSVLANVISGTIASTMAHIVSARSFFVNML